MTNMRNHPRPRCALLLAMLVAPSCQTAKHQGHATPAATVETKVVAPSTYYMAAHAPKALTAKPKNIGSLRDTTASLLEQLKSTPKSIGLQLSLAQLYLGDGNLVGAEKLARSVLTLNFANRDAKIILAHVAYLGAQFQAARTLLDQVGGAQASESEALNLMGCLAWRDLDPVKAEQLWVSAIKKNHSDLAARMNLGLALLKRDQYKGAQDLFKSVLAQWSDNPDATVHLAIAYALQGKTDEAISLYRDVRKQAPQSQLVLFNLAAAQLRAKEYKDAVDTLRQFLALKTLQYSGHDAALALLEEIRRDKGSDTKLSSAELDRMVEDEANIKSLSLPDEKENPGSMSSVGFYN